MSLINDALKRAKAAQQTGPSREAAAIPFKPVDVGQAGDTGKATALPAALLALTVVALFTVWFGLRRSDGRPHTASNVTAPAGVQQRPPQISSPQSPAVPQEGLPQAPSKVPVSPAAEEPRKQVAVPSGTASSIVPVATSTPPVPTSPAGPTIASHAPEVESHSSPPPLRLQAIFYNPARPSVMIGGKTVFIGDTVGEFRIEAIAAESATLVKVGQTNILTVAR
jgi:hypothetical protein